MKKNGSIFLAGMLSWSVCAFSTIRFTNRNPKSRETMLSMSAMATTKTRTLGLLSFDLDDTLFPTGKVVRSANEVMIGTMHGFGCTDASIPEFLANTKAIRSTLRDPITYTNLRKRSIRKTLLESKKFVATMDEEKDLDGIVEECYRSWLKERHAAAERFLFEDAVPTLQKIRACHPKVCIVAITNGAGNPLDMPNTLAPFFDFTVSGEDDDVFPRRKPNPYIYEHTLQKFGADLLAENGWAWCHVGDCLANDVGASASCGAHAIWMCTEDDENSAASRLVDTKKVPEYSTASTSELAKRAREIEAGKKAVEASIRCLSELPDVLTSILET